MTDDTSVPPEQPVEPVDTGPQVVPIPVHPEPMHLTIEGSVDIRVANAGEDLPQVLLWDGNARAYIACFLPSGSSWRLAPGLPRAALWVPGMPGGPQ